MSRIMGKIKLLTDTEMQLVHNAALDKLEQIGMKIYHNEAREILRNFGCHVDKGNKIVKFPYDMVENSLEKMLKNFLRPERKGLKQAIRYAEVRLLSMKIWQLCSSNSSSKKTSRKPRPPAAA